MSLDFTTCSEIISTLITLKSYIIIVKIHCDIIKDFSKKFIDTLLDICDKNEILIFEDRKFGDIGNTFKNQFLGGIYKIQSWCDITNFHSLVGNGTLDEFKNCKQKLQGGLLVAQMSNKGNFLDEDYTKKTIDLASSYRNEIFGFICQKN